MRFHHQVLLGTLLLPAAARAALPPKALDGGITLSAWFTPQEYDALGVDASNEVDYCDLFQETSNKLWITTEGQHYVKHVSFMIGAVQPGVRFSAGNGRATATFGGRIAFPHQLPLDVDEDSDVMNHEMGHYFYGLPDEYLEVATSGLGFCVDDDSAYLAYACTSVPESSCVSGADCAVINGCLGGTNGGKLCAPDGSGNTSYLFVEEADCNAGGGVCLVPAPGVCLIGDDIGDPCSDHDDCGGADYACSALHIDQITPVDVPAGEDSCLMAQSGEARWCGHNHQHVWDAFPGVFNALSLDQSLGVYPHVQDGTFATAADYNCWDLARLRHADLSWNGAYTSVAELGSPPATTCTWAIDDLALTGSTALVVDTSGSMVEDDAWSFAVDGAEYLNAMALADPMPGNVGLYQFDSQFQALPHASLSLEMGPVQDLGDGVDRAALEAYMDPNRKTHLCEALDAAAQELLTVPITDRKIVLLTDGRDTSPLACDPVAVAAELCGNGISVHALAYGGADIAATQAMTQAGCGAMKYAARGFFGLTGVHALQMGLARVGASVDGAIELLYTRQMVEAWMFAQPVDKALTVPVHATSLQLSWMGNDQSWSGEPLFNEAEYTVTSPSGVVYVVAGGQDADRARFRALEIDDPEPGQWLMTVDATHLAITSPFLFEVGWLATVDAPLYGVEAWSPRSHGVLGEPMPIRALATRSNENLIRLQSVTAEVVFEDQRWPITLHDDGMHGDEAVRDGIYGAYFVPTEVGPYAVEVSFTTEGGASQTTRSHIVVEDSFVMRADTAFQVLPDHPLQGEDWEAGPLILPDLYQGGVYPHLRTTLYGVPLSEATTVLSLGSGIEIVDLVLDCMSCGYSDLHMYDLWFDAVVSPDAALGLRDLTIQVGSNQYRLEDAVTVIPAPTATAFQAGELVVSEVMTAPIGVAEELGEWFEIYNPATRDVDLFGLEIRDAHRGVVHIQQSLVVPRRGYVVLSNGTWPTAGLVPDYHYEGMLLDAQDSLTLVSGRTTVDTVSWDRTFPVVAGASMTLDRTKLSATENDHASSWCASKVDYGVGGDHGTPGTANEVCATPGGGWFGSGSRGASAGPAPVLH